MEDNTKIQKLEKITGKVIPVEIDSTKKRFLCCGYGPEIRALCLLGRNGKEIVLYHVPIFQIDKVIDNNILKINSKIKYISYDESDEAYTYLNNTLIIKKL